MSSSDVSLLEVIVLLLLAAGAVLVFVNLVREIHRGG